MAKSASQKTTSPAVATKAAKTLDSNETGDKSKSAAASALSQVEPGKVTSEAAASDASDVLRDGRTADDSKSVAGSALSQTPGKKK